MRQHDSNSSSKPKSSVKGADAERVVVRRRSVPRSRSAKYVESLGYEYAGDCADATLPRDEGKWCSTLVESKSTGTESLRRRPGGREAREDGHGEAARRSSASRRVQNVPVADGNVGDRRTAHLRADARGHTFITEQPEARTSRPASARASPSSTASPARSSTAPPTTPVATRRWRRHRWRHRRSEHHHQPGRLGRRQRLPGHRWHRGRPADRGR